MQNQKKIVMELHPSEVQLIEKIREHYKFGEIIVECRDGLPFRIGKSITYEKLSWPFICIVYNVSNKSHGKTEDIRIFLMSSFFVKTY